jgi:hypothetical protein
MGTTINLADFIESGLLGSITLGTSKDEVRSYMGPPSDIGVGLGKVKIENYFGGVFEVSYLNGIVVLLAVYLSKRKVCDAVLALDLPTIVLESELAFTEWATSKGLFFKELINGDGSRSWKMENGVVVIYKDGKLNSVQISG